MSISEKAKVFMFVCIGLAALAAAANLWVPEVTAQVGDNQVVAMATDNNGTRLTLITASGDIFGKTIPDTSWPEMGWTLIDNPFGAVPSEGNSLGSIKGQFR